MSVLTIENIKEHCRTCLKKLKLENVNYLANVDEWSNEETKTITQEYPQCICLHCYKRLQSFVSFKNQVRNSTQKLQELVCLGAAKVEIAEDEDCQEIENNIAVQQTTTESFNLLLKDALMETESVMINTLSDVAMISNDLLYPDPFGNGTLVDIPKHEQEIDDICEASNNEEWQGFHDEHSNEELYKTAIDHDEDNYKTHKTNAETVVAETCKAQFNERSDCNLETKKYPTRSLRKRSLTFETGIADNNETTSTKVENLSEKFQLNLGTVNLDSTTKRRNKGTKNSFKCEQCSHCFAHQITLDAHIRKVHEGSKRPFQCDRCEKSYTFIGGLYTHIKEIHDAEVRSYACDISGCERVYTSFIAMQKHKRLKHSDTSCATKYVCEQCGATFNQSGNLKYHRRAKHPTEAEQAEKEHLKERFECDICKKLFYSRYTLKYHTLQLHTNETKYECNVCGRRMAKKFMLVQHMLVHSNDKMPCEHCGRLFIRKFELEAHVKAVHMKLKPFECQYCSECFASRKTLRHHEYIHTGEKPYVCDVCGQGYRQQTCLKNHRKSHEKFIAAINPTTNVNQELTNTFMVP
ncbi:zinc finger protein 726 isoform X2 [Zeugodacus cucurbitae]|uniref:zinc finger protein 726 isoform X2 n=1 Tax=Zeugodacus cucurbitae TaxID=28588 RepID=UPI0023D8EFBE|nr:zinc finger protein 726 isoform X2 [Zeugodacus cucurbitae]